MAYLVQGSAGVSASLWPATGSAPVRDAASRQAAVWLTSRDNSAPPRKLFELPHAVGTSATDTEQLVDLVWTPDGAHLVAITRPAAALLCGALPRTWHQSSDHSRHVRRASHTRGASTVRPVVLGGLHQKREKPLLSSFVSFVVAGSRTLLIYGPSVDGIERITQPNTLIGSQAECPVLYGTRGDRRERGGTAQFARRQKADDVGHVRRFFTAPERNRRHPLLPVLTGLLAESSNAHLAIDLGPHLGVHIAWTDAIHRTPSPAYAAARLRVRLITAALLTAYGRLLAEATLPAIEATLMMTPVARPASLATRPARRTGPLWH